MSTVELRLGGQSFKDVLTAEITRDLEEIAGGFTVELVDNARIYDALPGWWVPGTTRGPLAPGELVEIRLDDEPVLIGWVDAVKVNYGADKLLFTITGRDLTGDLVDCAAAPNGPAEYSGLTLAEICARICAPFGITVAADVDVGERFPKFGIEPAEMGMPAIEKGCRQRAVLAVSDGVGGLRLTRGGRTAAPAELVFGGNIVTMDATFDHSERFAEYIVKGQAARGRAGAGVAARNTAAPLTEAAPASRPTATSPAGARPRVVMTGRARDLAVTRYRPSVSMAKTQSGGATVQQQADWRMRTHRAKAENLRVTVKGWRAGKDDRLWRINERVVVRDPLSRASAELLVASLVWRLNKGGPTTEMKLCGCDAFDVLLEGADTRRQGQQRRPATNNAASALTADPPPRTSTPAPSRGGR